MLNTEQVRPMEGVPIQLGGRPYQLVPQRIGRIRRHFSRIASVMGQVADGEASEVAQAGSTQVYDALKVFIPDLVPEWKFLGYASEEVYNAKREHDAAAEQEQRDYAYQRGEQSFDALPAAEQAAFVSKLPPFVEPDTADEADESPTPPEIANALERIFEIHGGQRLIRLLRPFVPTNLLQSVVQKALEDWASGPSQSLPSANGASTSTPSTTPPPTSEPSADSPSPGS